MYAATLIESTAQKTQKGATNFGALESVCEVPTGLINFVPNYIRHPVTRPERPVKVARERCNDLSCGIPLPLYPPPICCDIPQDLAEWYSGMHRSSPAEHKKVIYA